MTTSFVHAVETRLWQFHQDDEQLRLLLTYCVGRLMLRDGDAQGSLLHTTSSGQLRHIRDWLKAAIANDEAWLKNVDEFQRPKKLMKFSTIEGIVKEANKAMLKAAQRLSAVKIVAGDETLFAMLEDGYSVVRLMTPAALDRESAQMQHCIGNGAYDHKLDNPDNLYLSLRDRHGKPHATLEVKSGRLIELQGKQNEAPIEKYKSVLIPFLKKTKWKMRIPVSWLGFIIDAYEEWHPLDKLPEGLTINGNLYLSGTGITSLPRRLTVTGRLDLRGTEITELPDMLTVDGSLILGEFIKTLPRNLNIKGSINAYNAPLMTIPEDLKVGGDLYLPTVKIVSLPKGLAVGGNLDVRYTRLTELPEGLNVGGDLILTDSDIEKLPDELTVQGDIYIQYTKITEIPDCIPQYTIIHTDEGKMNAAQFRAWYCQPSAGLAL